MLKQKRIKKPKNLPECPSNCTDFNRVAKPYLIKMAQNHCSYCDKHFWDEGDFEVEHFKRIADFPDLRCDWDNLFASCHICNTRQNYKRYSENPKPFRPDEKGYDFGKYFYFEQDTGEIIAISDFARANKTIDYLAINNPSLCAGRRKFYLEIENQKQAYPNVSFRFIVEQFDNS